MVSNILQEFKQQTYLHCIASVISQKKEEKKILSPTCSTLTQQNVSYIYIGYTHTHTHTHTNALIHQANMAQLFVLTKAFIPIVWLVLYPLIISFSFLPALLLVAFWGCLYFVRTVTKVKSVQRIQWFTKVFLQGFYWQTHFIRCNQNKFIS